MVHLKFGGPRVYAWRSGVPGPCTSRLDVGHLGLKPHDLRLELSGMLFQSIDMTRNRLHDVVDLALHGIELGLDNIVDGLVDRGDVGLVGCHVVLHGADHTSEIGIGLIGLGDLRCVHALVVLDGMEPFLEIVERLQPVDLLLWT